MKYIIYWHIRFDNTGFEEKNEKAIIETFTPEECYCMKEISTTPAWGKIYHKSVVEQLRFPEGVIHEDYYYTWKAIFSEERIAVVFKDLYYYFYNEKGIMHSEWVPKRMDIFQALDEKIEFFQKNGYIKALERAIHKKARMIEKYENKVQGTVYEKEYLMILENMRNEVDVWKDD